jgi:DNA-directed RNA polymerase specialized sigma24 family protein
MPFYRRNTTRIKEEACLTEAEAHRMVTDIVRTYGPNLRNVLLKHGVPARDVDDELQRVWETVRQNVGQLRGKLQTWLVRAAINRVADRC